MSRVTGRLIIAAANTVVRTQLAKAKAVVDLATAKRHAKELAQATAEFDSLVATVHSKRTSMPDALRYMRLVCIEDKSDADCADVFPGTNRDQRYQWLKRARDFVLLLASDVLKSVLWKSIGTKRKAK